MEHVKCEWSGKKTFYCKVDNSMCTVWGKIHQSYLKMPAVITNVGSVNEVIDDWTDHLYHSFQADPR